MALAVPVALEWPEPKRPCFCDQHLGRTTTFMRIKGRGVDDRRTLHPSQLPDRCSWKPTSTPSMFRPRFEREFSP